MRVCVQTRSQAGSKSMARSLVQQVKTQHGLLQLLAGAGAGMVALGLTGKLLRGLPGASRRGDNAGFSVGTQRGGRSRALYERRRMQCEASNKEAHVSVFHVRACLVLYRVSNMLCCASRDQLGTW